jgi:hypothetical protein
VTSEMRPLWAINTVGAYQDHLNRFPSCVFAGLAQERIAHLSQPRNVAVQIAAMQRPIDNLFEAWRRLNLESYLRQWAPNGIKIALERNKRFTVAQLASERGRLFSQLSAVDARYLPAFQGSVNGIAHFNVTYNMRFDYKNGRKPIREVACESYKVRKESVDWLIVENRDYEPC